MQGRHPVGTSSTLLQSRARPAHSFFRFFSACAFLLHFPFPFSSRGSITTRSSAPMSLAIASRAGFSALSLCDLQIRIQCVCPGHCAATLELFHNMKSNCDATGTAHSQ